MKIMIATRPAMFVVLRFVFATLAVVCLQTAAGGAGETGDQAAPQTAADSPPPPRRSHIQPVGEIAAASRDSDTLGLRLSRASEVLRQQLALARGAGLVVEEVIPGSVAESAGFKRHDVLVLLDDQMLLLPEQLKALLDASEGNATPECTLLRGGAKVTLPLGHPDRSGRPTLPTPSKPVGPPTVAAVTPAVPVAAPPLPAVRQTAAKQPSTSSRLRTPASALALVQPNRSVKPGKPTSAIAPEEETLLRQDPDYQIKLTRGNETRLVVLDPNGRIMFNDEIDTPERRSLVPPDVRQRVEEMERSLEPVTKAPIAEIGRLDVLPVEIR